MANALEGESDLDLALLEVYRHEYRPLVRLAALLVDDRDTAEEVVQDAFVRVHVARSRVDDPERLAAYVRRAVLNGARSRLRRRVTGRRLAIDSSPYTTERVAAAAEHEALARTTRAEVLAAVRRLPDRQRECVLLRYFLDLSEADTAATLGVSAGTVKTSCHRALATLELHLEALR